MQSIPVVFRLSNLRRRLEAMMIRINQQLFELPEASTIDGALKAFGAKPPFAVALNGVFVHRAQYPLQTLKDQDLVEIVQPVAGG